MSRVSLSAASVRVSVVRCLKLQSDVMHPRSADYSVRKCELVLFSRVMVDVHIFLMVLCYSISRVDQPSGFEWLVKPPGTESLSFIFVNV